MKEREGYFRIGGDTTNASRIYKYGSTPFRERIWLFFENPETSLSANIYAVISFLFIAISVALTCILTIPSIKNRHKPNLFKDEFFLVELVLNSFFGLEYLCRFFSAPRTMKFLMSPLNLFDFSAVFPYFILLCIDPNKVSTVGFLKMIRTVRVLRLFRLTKQSQTVHTVMVIMSQCINDLVTVFVCLLITSIISASLEYYTECNVPGTKFTSIPQSMWWAIQTLVCLGYGDIVPVSTLGKVVGSAVGIFGAITLTVPLLSIGGRYLIMYSKQFEVPIGEDMDTGPSLHKSLSASVEDGHLNAEQV